MTLWLILLRARRQEGLIEMSRRNDTNNTTIKLDDPIAEIEDNPEMHEVRANVELLNREPARSELMSHLHLLN